MWYRTDCNECGKDVGFDNLTQGGLCKRCEYRDDYDEELMDSMKERG